MTAPALTPRWARATQPRALRAVIYGTGGIGKTTLAASFPGAMVLRTEDGLGILDVPATGICTTYADVTGAVGDLFAMPPGTLVLDSLDWLEPIVWAETCVRGQKKAIEDFGYGKGYLAALEVWRELLAGLAALNALGWAIVLVAHDQVKRFDAPESESFDRYLLKLHDKAAALVVEWADCVFFAHWETLVQDRENGKSSSARAIGTGHRLLATQRRPAWDAKSRFPLPELIKLDAASVIPALLAAGATLPAITTTIEA